MHASVNPGVENERKKEMTRNTSVFLPLVSVKLTKAVHNNENDHVRKKKKNEFHVRSTLLDNNATD